jgi:hypothetical protein
MIYDKLFETSDSMYDNKRCYDDVVCEMKWSMKISLVCEMIMNK